MDANKILDADPLDIIFDGRNKQYGAYELRKHYRQRLGKSILIMFGVLCLMVGVGFLSGFIKPETRMITVGGEIDLKKIVEPPKEEKKVEPVIIKPAAPKGVSVPTPIKMKQFTTFAIEKDPPEDQKPPINSELENVKIGTANINDGAPDEGKITPPAGVKEGLVAAPTKGTDDGTPFLKVEKESEYPGGMKAWVKFLERNLFNNLPEDAVENGVAGTVVLRFVVDVDGSISDINYVSGPKEYVDVATKAIRKSGKWTPALQNGHFVKSYKSQAITIRLGE